MVDEEYDHIPPDATIYPLNETADPDDLLYMLTNDTGKNNNL